MESQDYPSSQSLGPLRTFTCFPRLPIEIMQRIWKLTLEPRVIELLFDCGPQDYMRDYDDNKVLLYSKQGFHARVRTPVALEVNQDSRQAVLPATSYALDHDGMSQRLDSIFALIPYTSTMIWAKLFPGCSIA